MNLGKFGPYLPKFGPKKFFFEIWASSLFLTYLRLVSCKKSKKSYERLRRKTPDRRTDGRTNERTNGSESIGPTSEVGGSNNWKIRRLNFQISIFQVCVISNSYHYDNECFRIECHFSVLYGVFSFC